MRRMSWLATAASLMTTIAAWSAPAVENIALGKRYRLHPRPNYSYCTDKDDRVQLTDGVYTEGYFWTQKTTVGWRFALPATITLDLGKVEPISGVSYNTAAGVAGVRWPDSILVLVSDDGKTYYLAGDLVKLDAEHGKLPEERYAKRRFWTPKLATYGRYVMLMVTTPGPYTFVDEIEVYRGDDALLAGPRNAKEAGDPRKFFTNMLVSSAFKRRLRADLAAVADAAPASLKHELAALRARIDGTTFAMPEDFRAVLPVNDLHRRIFAAQAKVWRQRFPQPLVVWQTCQWDMLSPTEPPHRGGATIDVAMMRNECRSAAFNLSNTADAAIEVSLRLVGLPQDAACVDVHEGVFTDTKTGVPVVAALPYARRERAAASMTLEAGMHKQVWLTFNSKDVAAGTYTGKIVVQPGGVDVPVRLRVYPLTFPQQPTLHLGGWDYTDSTHRDVTPENREALIAHLRERFVDTPWATRGVLPSGKYDTAGNMTEPPSTDRFKAWVERWSTARVYCVFVALSPKFAGFEEGTPEFKAAVAAWITWWAAEIRECGVKPSQLGLLLVDEPHSHKQDKTIIEYARVIQEAAPEVIVWEDPTWRKPWDALPELFAVSDVLCPNLPMWIEHGKEFADFYVKQRNAGRELWFYSCSGPGKLLDPYSYHRMQHWFCWKYDAKGSCFWSFGDSSAASSWNEYLAKRGAYTPVFLDATSVTPGKHMEAIREGIEDYEYLRMLRDRIAQVEKTADAKTVAAAKQLLATAADRVTACMDVRDKINWAEAKDRSVADAVRVEVLEMLTRLE